MTPSERLKDYWQRVRNGELPKPKRDPNAPKTFRVRCNSSRIRGHEVQLTVYKHGEIGIRELNRRDEFKVSVAECLRIAVNIAVSKQLARIKDLRKTGLYTLAQARRQARKELFA